MNRQRARHAEKAASVAWQVRNRTLTNSRPNFDFIIEQQYSQLFDPDHALYAIFNPLIPQVAAPRQSPPRHCN
ncbi:hypothetical protein [Paludibacterium sp.]|uniref:hypothetical protein n=1 Tax=Paludibacterium sp. TaxID=1917523 RepID=UPI0025FBEE1F|nr:hypothetical protein [Paludibacterium sp.]MBV8648655.1 hypothetical protein [Paludibacterium sp.]